MASRSVWNTAKRRWKRAAISTMKRTALSSRSTALRNETVWVRQANPHDGSLPTRLNYGRRLHEVLEIHVQVGKTGTLTPVAELQTVEIAGTKVSRVSLHNADEIVRKDIRIGDHVIVEKAGKIIPHVVRVELEKRSGQEKPFIFPSKCPVCQGDVGRDEGGVYIRCLNPSCPAQLKERLQFFASRAGNGY